VRDPSLQKLNDTNIDAGGPFVKDRLWWFGSFRNYNTHENVPGFVTDNGTSIDFLSNLRNYTASTKYQINKNNQLSGFWTYNKKFQPHRGASATQPDPITTINQQSVKHLFNGNWTSVMGQNSFLEVSSTFFHMHWPSLFSDEFYALPDSEKVASSFDITSGIYFDGPEPTGERHRDAYRQQVNVGLTRYIDGFIGASHQLKTGFENWYGWGTDGFNVFQDTRLRYREDANGVPQPSELFAYNTPLGQKTKMRNFAAFVQDRLTYNRVTLNLGVRWSYYDGTIPAQTGGGGLWYPEVSYPEIKTPYNWNTLAPRTGLVWKVTEDGRNVAKASYSRYYESMYTTEFNAINPNFIRTTGVATYAWTGDANGNGIVDPGEYNPTPKSVYVPTSNTIDPKLRDPKNDEIMFAYQREVMNNVSFSANWIQRWFNDHTMDIDQGIPTSAYSASQYTDFGADNLRNTADDRQVTFYNVSDEFLGQDAFFHTNCDCTQRYKGLELTVSKRMSNRWQMMGSYVWSRLDGEFILDPTDPNNLVDSVRNGRGPTDVVGSGSSNDQPHAFKLLGSYQAPFGITVGANYQALSGLPIDRVLSVPLSQGTTSYRVEERGTHRSDMLNLLSIRADKSFRINGPRRISIVAEVHNLLNSSAGQSNYGSLTRNFASQAAFDAARATTSYFGRVQEIVAPRILKLGFRFEF
jgi:hypothetical protein